MGPACWRTPGGFWHLQPEIVLACDTTCGFSVIFGRDLIPTPCRRWSLQRVFAAKRPSSRQSLVSDSRYSRLLLISEEQGFMLPLFVLGPYVCSLEVSWCCLNLIIPVRSFAAACRWKDRGATWQHLTLRGHYDRLFWHVVKTPKLSTMARVELGVVHFLPWKNLKGGQWKQSLRLQWRMGF